MTFPKKNAVITDDDVTVYCSFCASGVRMINSSVIGGLARTGAQLLLLRRIYLGKLFAIELVVSGN